MLKLNRPIPLRHVVCALSAVACLAATSANALSLGAIDEATFDSITGASVASLTNSYDFTPSVNGGDGLVTSSVYAGTGAASGYYVYVYQIELYPAPPASVGAIWGMQWSFHQMPVELAGVGESFYVGDDGGDVAPTMASWLDGEASVVLIPPVGNAMSSHAFGFLSPNGPDTTLAQLIDSGALGGTVAVLSNGAGGGGGVAPMPEPSAALVFGVGLLLVRTRFRR